MGTPSGQLGSPGGQIEPAPEGTGRRARRALEAGAPEGGPVAVPPQGQAPQAEGPPQQQQQPQQPQPQPQPEQTWPTPGGSATPEQEQARPALPAQPAWPQVAQGPASARSQDARSQDSRLQDPRSQDPSHQSHGRSISVRTLGQGVPFAVDPRSSQTQTPTQAVQAQNPEGLPAQVAAGGSGRRRRLSPQQGQAQPSHILPQVPSQPSAPGTGESHARQHPQADPDSGQLPARAPAPEHRSQPQRQQIPDQSGPKTAPLPPVVPPEPAQPPHAPGRSYAIGAPAAGAAEGPEPLDGPNGAVDVTDVNDAHDDRQDEPFEEPRRLLVWPEPDVSTRQALTDRGYRPVTVRSREEVDAQVAEPPAALFVDPLTGPITRTALQSLRQAAAAADVPVLVTAGLGQATREAAYGADPAVLLKALAPRDSEQHPPRVLLVESHQPIAQAFAATLERRGMQVTHAGSETDAMTKAAQVHPNLVVMDLMLIRRRRQGIVDWLRGNSRLNSTPLVVYTSAGIDPAELPRLASGETVLFLAERSTSSDVQARIVDLLGKIGT
jgi:CheY-like chemotaxis protein